MTTEQRNLVVIGIIIAMAAIGGLVAILVSSSNATPTVTDYSNIPSARQSDGGFVLGSPDAPITIVEFADFLCPHCQEYEATTGRFIQTYVITGMARYEYRMFPVIDPTLSTYTANLAECSDAQLSGSFWSAKGLLFQYAAARRIDPATITRTFANDMQLDYGTLVQCVGQADQVQTDALLGRSLGVSGTPAVMVRYGNGAPEWITFNGQIYNRGGVPFDVLSAVVQAAQAQ
ncbi:MAG: thioredoxin domain-containing protein [Chloroflexi bacterium]|nr:thioredoxin domain-containing protein [Chloroflexota bacterium]